MCNARQLAVSLVLTLAGVLMLHGEIYAVSPGGRFRDDKLHRRKRRYCSCPSGVKYCLSFLASSQIPGIRLPSTSFACTPHSVR